MIANLVLGFKLLADLLLLPLLCGALSAWITARLYRRRVGWRAAALCGLLCALVYGAGVLAGAWRDGALLAYAVLVLTAALGAAWLTARR
jgi:hypothetical protein